MKREKTTRQITDYTSQQQANILKVFQNCEEVLIKITKEEIDILERIGSKYLK